ncbi:MAG: hypothetical protein K8V75_05430 [Methanobrevibacter woesei]|nr:hypothetical protein [Candidatus Alectryobacillus merdavium]MCC9261801.1 hypothetical protein [Methanobrevibacter woesei]
MNNKDDTIQIIESYLNILLKTLPNDEYIMLIENTPILNEYDNLMSEFKEDNLSETFLQQVLYLVKNITDNKVKNCL